MFPLSCICAELDYSLCQVNWIVDGKKRIEGKHTMSTYVGMGSFFNNLANLGKQKGVEQQDNQCNMSVMLPVTIMSVREPMWQRRCYFLVIMKTGLTLLFHCCKNNGMFSKNKVSKFHTNRTNCYFIEHIINLWW